MRPAINVARYGFPVTQDLVNQEKNAIAGGPNFLVDDPSFAIDFAPNGTLLGLNETITRKRYADTLETIAERGPDAFYTGSIANATIAALRASNGTMTLEDLKNYTVGIRKPAQITYRDYKLTSCSAPSSGTVALSVMKTIEGYSGFGQQSAINLTTHRLDEAIRFAYGEVGIFFAKLELHRLTLAQRSSLGDPSFVEGLDMYQQQMLNDTTAVDIRSRISDVQTLNVSAYDPKGLESLST